MLVLLLSAVLLGLPNQRQGTSCGGKYALLPKTEPKHPQSCQILRLHLCLSARATAARAPRACMLVLLLSAVLLGLPNQRQGMGCGGKYALLPKTEPEHPQSCQILQVHLCLSVRAPAARAPRVCMLVLLLSAVLLGLPNQRQGTSCGGKYPLLPKT